MKKDGVTGKFHSRNPTQEEMDRGLKTSGLAAEAAGAGQVVCPNHRDARNCAGCLDCVQCPGGIDVDYDMAKINQEINKNKK